jgi:hypothetical protein
MDVKKIRETLERYHAVFSTLAVGVTTQFFEVLKEPWDWRWYHYVFAALLVTVPGVLVFRSLRGHSSRLLDPDALTLDPGSPEQLFGRAEDLPKLLMVSAR